MNEDEILNRAALISRALSQDKIKENHLGIVLSHLKKHKNLQATRNLLRQLISSPFATRTQSTRDQFNALEKKLGKALSDCRTWEDAALLVGWVRRLLIFYRSSSG